MFYSRLASNFILRLYFMLSERSLSRWRESLLEWSFHIENRWRFTSLLLFDLSRGISVAKFQLYPNGRVHYILIPRFLYHCISGRMDLNGQIWWCMIVLTERSTQLEHKVMIGRGRHTYLCDFEMEASCGNVYSNAQLREFESSTIQANML